MPIDISQLLWLVPAVLALAALAWWWRNRAKPTQPQVEPATAPGAEPPPIERAPGRDYKLAIGSAGVKTIVREARMEEAYQVRFASETAFEAFADFDTQQERIAIANRPPGPACLKLSETLEAHSVLTGALATAPRPTSGRCARSGCPRLAISWRSQPWRFAQEESGLPA